VKVKCEVYWQQGESERVSNRANTNMKNSYHERMTVATRNLEAGVALGSSFTRHRR